MEVRRIFGIDQSIAISMVGYAETLAVFYRKKREVRIHDKEFSSLVAHFRSEWVALLRVNLTLAVNELVETLLAEHSLRGFDAIHLASAVRLRNDSNTDVKFVCADEQLNLAASEEGLSVVNPCTIS